MAVTPASTPLTTGYVALGELQMYYQVHGTGDPILLLHGGLTTIETSFGNVLPSLASDRQIIAVEQQAHGRTADINRSLRFEQMADDTARLLRDLGVKKLDIFGYSDGGNVALGLAIRHPDLVQSLTIAGTNSTTDGLFPEIYEMLANARAEDMPDELRLAYERVAPDPGSFAVLVEKVSEQSVSFPGWTSEQLKSIQCRSLIIIGDRDIVQPEHALKMYRTIPNAELAIIPGTGHGMRLESPDLLLSILSDFLSRANPENDRA